MVGIEDVLNPTIFPSTGGCGRRHDGHILHGSANSIGGKCTVIKLRWGKTRTRMIFPGALPGIKVCPGRESQACWKSHRQRIGAAMYRALSSHSHGRGDVISQASTRLRRYPAIVERLQREDRAGRTSHCAAPRPQAGAIGGSGWRANAWCTRIAIGPTRF